MKNTFYNKDGTLTKYALACGYVEKYEGLKGYVKLWQEYHVFHVLLHLSHSIEETSPKWLTFDYGQLTKARKQFQEFKKITK